MYYYVFLEFHIFLRIIMTDQKLTLAERVQAAFDLIVISAREEDKPSQRAAWLKLRDVLGCKTQMDLAKIINTSQGKVAQCETGVVHPNKKSLTSIAQAISKKFNVEIKVKSLNDFSKDIFLELLAITKDLMPGDILEIQSQGAESTMNARISNGITAGRFANILDTSEKYGLTDVTISRTNDRKGIIIRPIGLE